MRKRPKKRKPGRPRLAAHEAKGKIVPVRLTASQFERVAAAAEKKQQSVSQWVRSTLNAAMEA